MGQSAVEFALVVPVFVVLVFGAIDGARLVAASNTIAQASREAARLASVQAAYVGATGPACDAPVCPASTTEFADNVRAAANHMTPFVGNIQAADVHIMCTPLGSAPSGDWTGGNTCASANHSGDVVTVRIEMPIRSLTPILDPVYPASLSAAATMAIP